MVVLKKEKVPPRFVKTLWLSGIFILGFIFFFCCFFHLFFLLFLHFFFFFFGKVADRIVGSR